MRLTYVIDSLHQGGAEASLVQILPEYHRIGIETTVVPLKPGGLLEGDAAAAGAEVAHIPVGSRRQTVASLRDLLRTRKPDLVHTTLFESDIAGRTAAALAGVPVVTSLVSDSYGPHHRADPRLRLHRTVLAQATDIATSTLATAFHANAEHVATTMSRRLLVPRSRIAVVPRGRAGERAQPRAMPRSRVRRELGLLDHEPLVLVLARHDYAKGIDVAVRAMARMTAQPAPVLCVAGREGAATEALQGLIRSSGVGDRVRLLGYRRDVAELLAAADALALPSRREGLPGALIEALAAEVPVVAVDLPGVREVLGPVPAPLVAVDDAQALADGLGSLLAHPAARERSTTLGRERFVDVFSLPKVAERMLGFYESALGTLAGANRSAVSPPAAARR